MTGRRRLVALLVTLAVAVTPALTGCSGGSETDDSAGKASELPFENAAKVKGDAGAWREVFSDDVEGDALDPDKWRTREQPPMGVRKCA